MMNGQRYLIITGSHPDVREDINAVPWARTDTAPEELWRLYDYMAIGLDAVDKYLWPVKYVATYHPAELPEIRSRREAVGGNLDYRTIAHDKTNDPDIVIADWWRPSGSSALLGVQAAIRMGYQRIILCGCPLIGKNDKAGSYETFRRGWEARRQELEDRVRSMSGWTREYLGAPDREWLMTGWAEESA